MNNSELIFNLISSMNDRVSFVFNYLLNYNVHFYGYFLLDTLNFLNNFYTKRFFIISLNYLPSSWNSCLLLRLKLKFLLNFYDFILVYFLIFFDNFSTYISAQFCSFWILSFHIMTE